MKGKYHIVTYGCQMNVHESEKIAGILENLGYTYSEIIEESQVIMFNTCCIRENAEHRAYGNIGALKKYKQQNKNVIIGVCGCMTQQDGVGEKLKKRYPFIDIILGTNNLESLAEAVIVQESKKQFVINVEHGESYTSNDIPIYRTSGVNGWVNIVYGCNNFCTYCIVPYVRGREKSRKFDDIVFEVRELLEKGYKEITLLGQNVNSYGNDLNKENEFARLLSVLAELPFKYRLKFMTSHPKDLSDEVINTIAKYDNISNYIHLPVQAGSDNILGKMNRKYTSGHYLNLIKKIKDKIPNCGITSDIMVGFPGESDEDFSATLNLVKKVEFSSAFTFVYSRRSGTVADEMDGQISEEIKSKRIGELIELQNAISIELSKSYLNKVYEVLIEGKSVKPNMLSGRTDCGKLVNIDCDDESLIGQFKDILITKSGVSTLTGVVNK